MFKLIHIWTMILNKALGALIDPFRLEFYWSSDYVRCGDAWKIKEGWKFKLFDMSQEVRSWHEGFELFVTLEKI